MRRAITIIVILVLVIGGSAGVYWYLNQQPTSGTDEDLETGTVTRMDLLERVSATGQVEPEKETKLAFDMSGKVVEVLVLEGDVVKEGQALARLDADDLETRATQARQALESKEIMLTKAQEPASAEDIEAALADLESAEAAYQKVLEGPTENDLIIARADLERAEAALKKAQSDYDQVSWIGGIEAMPQSVALEQATIDYERALASYRKVEESPTDSDIKSAEAQVTRAQTTLETLGDRPKAEDVELAKLDVEMARDALVEAEADLEDAVLEAPHAGTIATAAVESEEWVSGGNPVITLIDASKVHVDVLVDEVDVGKVREGQQVDLTLDSFPDEELSGHVDFIAPAPTNEAGLISYKVSIDLESNDLPVRMGMTANAEIVTHEELGALVVPNRAIEVDRDDGRYYVAKLEDGVPARTEIELGLRSETHSQVISGLEEGDEFAIMTVSSRDRLRAVFEGEGQ
jgi:HlyD family secretion protein